MARNGIDSACADRVDTMGPVLGESILMAFMKRRPEAGFPQHTALAINPDQQYHPPDAVALPRLTSLPPVGVLLPEQPPQPIHWSSHLPKHELPHSPLDSLPDTRDQAYRDQLGSPSEKSIERNAVLPPLKRFQTEAQIKPETHLPTQTQPRDRSPEKPTTESDDSDDDSENSGDDRVPMKERVYTIPAGRGGGGRRYACRSCDRPFKRKCHVYDHIRRIHDKIRPYPCPQCDHTFPQKSSRDRHVQIVHEKKKPHVCDQCHKAFGKKNALTVHIRTVHRKERPFDCTICSATFGVRSHLNKHVRIVHNRSKPHICERCNASFGELSELKEHRTIVHFIHESSEENF